MTKRYEKPVLHKINRGEADAVRSGKIEMARIVQSRQDRHGRVTGWDANGQWIWDGDPCRSARVIYVDDAHRGVTGILVGYGMVVANEFPGLNDIVTNTRQRRALLEGEWVVDSDGDND